jgi:MoaA/NifB/PqqE/SkfB family radical SAM enzyme
LRIPVCEFCLSWLMKGAWLDYTILDRLSEPLRYASYIDLAGYGEPLAHPDFAAVIDRLERYIDPRCRLVLFTNGALLGKWIDRLLDLNVSVVAISLNAATANTHDAVRGLGPKVFDRVLVAIRLLRETAAARGKPMTISASLVVTQTNMHEVADFVRLCGTLPIDMAYLRVLQLTNGHANLPTATRRLTGWRFRPICIRGSRCTGKTRSRPLLRRRFRFMRRQRRGACSSFRTIWNSAPVHAQNR